MQKLFLVHTPKCGGKSFREGLKEAFGDELRLQYSNPLKRVWLGRLRELIKPVRRSEIAGKRVVYGHYSFDRYRKVHRQANVSRGMFFRDPLTLMCSHYFYQKEKVAGRVEEGFMEFVSQTPQRKFYSSFLGNTRVEELDFVGLFEDYPRSLRLFSETFQVDIEEHRRNETKARPTDYQQFLEENDFTDPLREQMRENIAIYDRAKTRYLELCDAAKV